MRLRRTALVCVVVLCGCATAPTAIESSALSRQMLAELQTPNARATPDSPLAAVASRHFLFVAGFLNELIPGYFDDNEVVTRELGGQTSKLFPSSMHSMSEQADEIYESIEASHAANGMPVVVVGHSMGGAAALLAAIRHPELMRNGTLDRVIVIQGAIGGSPVADAIAHGPVRAFHGLNSLTRPEATKLFASELARLHAAVSPAEVERLFEHVYYVRSCVSHTKTTPLLSASQLFLSLVGSHEADGLLLQEDMKLPTGVDLGLVDSDHGSLTVSGYLSQSTRPQRRMFTRALYRQVFAQAPASAPATP